jgi:two-component system, LytTR family, response regulator
MKINCIIVDDEPRAHKVLENYISRIPDISLVSTFFEGPKALNFLQATKVDLAFLDITMPEMNGFNLLDSLTDPPAIIFTTAHSKFALESYDYSAIDYLKKPISFERFLKAIEKLIVVAKNKHEAKPLSDHIDLRVDGEVISIPFTDIQYFQSLGNYVKVITSQKMLLTQITTKEIEENIPKELFVRIHKSYIVNKTLIGKVMDESIQIGTVTLPIGKTFKRYVVDATR